jgi:hypothetical protein
VLGVEYTRTEYLESFTFILLGRHAVQIRFIYCTSRSGSDIDLWIHFRGARDDEYEAGGEGLGDELLQ